MGSLLRQLLGRSRAEMRIARMVLLLALLPGWNLIADEKPKVLWSVDLRSNGIKEAIWEYHYWGAWEGIAANTKTVAVALRCPSAPLGKGPYRGEWEVRLLVFDARTGNLLAQRGPWTDMNLFTLRSTAEGNYLLLLQPRRGWGAGAKETLLLLSAGGEELKRLELENSRRKGIFLPPNVFQSPSGKALVVESESSDGWQYQVLATDTLEARMHWTETAGATRPTVIAVSDEKVLASNELWGEPVFNSNKRKPEFFVREFGAPWSNSSRVGLAANEKGEDAFLPTAFLGEGEFVGQACRNPNCWEVAVAERDGRVVSRHRLPRSSGYNLVRTPPTVTKDERYFAVEQFHESDLSHWWDSTMDMSAFGVKFFVYVWDVKAENPIVKITLGERLHAYCFVEGETLSLAVLDGPNLRLLSIETRGAAR